MRMRQANARKVLIVQRRDTVGHGEPQSFTYRPPAPGSSLPEARTSDCLLERLMGERNRKDLPTLWGWEGQDDSLTCLHCYLSPAFRKTLKWLIIKASGASACWDGKDHVLAGAGLGEAGTARRVQGGGPDFHSTLGVGDGRGERAGGRKLGEP